MPGLRRPPLRRLPTRVVNARTWNAALSASTRYALKVSLCYLVSGLVWIFLFGVAGRAREDDWYGFNYVIELFSTILVYPFALALGTAFFRCFPERMNGRRSWRAALTGSIASLLVWSGLGEWILKNAEQVQRSIPALHPGWIDWLILCTPFAMALSLSHALALILPPGRGPGLVLPRRLSI